METLSMQQILFDGLLISLLLTIIIFGSLYINPRLWLQDFPRQIREKAPPLTPAEKRLRTVIMVLFLAAVVVPLYISALRVEATNGGNAAFLTVFVHVFLVFNIFNLFDALVIDYLILAQMRPKFALIPEAEGLEHLFMDWRMHVGNYLKGIVFCAVFSLPIALLVVLL
jgi:hypothetical protein